MATSTPVIGFDYDYQHFTLDRLKRILPIGQLQPLGDIDFTLLALECYRAGFAATALLEQDWQLPEPGPNSPDFEPPQMFRGSFVISEGADDLGNRYTGRMRAGNGSGDGKGRIRGHYVFSFAPALNPAARSLTLTFMQVEEPRHGPDGPPRRGNERVIGGPWTVCFVLDGRPAKGNTSARIIPVGKQLASDDVRVVVTTIEDYSTRFVANIRLDWHDAVGPMPQLIWHVSDDWGQEFSGGDCGGSGGGENPNSRAVLIAGRIPIFGKHLAVWLASRPRGQSWRMNCHFQPGIDPEARGLILGISAVRLTRPVLSRENQHTPDRRDVKREVVDLGTIAIPLTNRRATAEGSEA